MVVDILSKITEANDHISSAVNKQNFNNLSGLTFSVFINTCKSDLDIPNYILKEASTNILTVLLTGSLEKDNQTLAAAALCSIEAFLHNENPARFVDCIVNLLRDDIYRNCKIHICNGIVRLRTQYFSDNLSKCPESREILFRNILEIIYYECSQLNSVTLLAFDSLDKILSIISTIKENGHIATPIESFKPLLHIVMSNLENPMPGVRQKNCSIMHTVLMYFYKDLWEGVLPSSDNIYTVGEYKNDIKYRIFFELVLSQLPWTMKAKYVLLNVISQNCPSNILLKVYGNEVTDGLLFSLFTTHLVSAGEDLYKATMCCELDEWVTWYFKPISNIMSHPELSLALENLLNHWFQRPLNIVPKIIDLLLKEVPSINLYAYISLLKLSRKGAYSSFDWKTVDKRRLKVALEGYSDKIRSQAFSLICISNKTSAVPSEEEFRAVQTFLEQNINTDNAAFRQNMLSSFTNFSIRIRDCILSECKAGCKAVLLEKDDALTHCLVFLDWLHYFFICNLEVRSNYQRKITTLELYRIILTYFGKPVGSTIYTRKSNKQHLHLKEVADSLSWAYMFESEIYQDILINCLFDEDSDVRDLSVNILLKYFDKSDFLKLENFKTLFQDGLTLSSSQIFYKAESGALIIHYLLTLAEQLSQSSCYISHDRIQLYLDEFIFSAEDQFVNLKKDLLKSIYKEKFLYGTLQVLRITATGDGALKMKVNHLGKLLTLLEEVVKYFMSILSSKSEPDLDSAPSFGEMGEAISELVNQSSLKEAQENEKGSILVTDSMDDLHLTPAQQLVLNCIWLNLKESSMLCSKLIENQYMDYENTERCLLMVISILRKCRHKGVIEAAGLALSKMTGFLTQRTAHPGTDCRYLSLPEKVMNDFLQVLVKGNPSTVSRRSAGLCILVHKLIAADARHSKPLLPHCVSFLLALAKEKPSAHHPGTLADLPQSQSMHFLRAIVQDASLKQHLLPYYLDIFVITLTNLASPVWTIRNAALQLLGAFVPKLVGQKPQEKEYGKCSQYLMFEELYDHAKPLINKLLDSFSEAAKSDSTTVHSKLMPILALVTNLNVGLQTILSDDVSKVVAQFREYFLQLFKSRIINIRKLCAKAHSQFLLILELIPTICQRSIEIRHFLTGKESVIFSINELHGYLLNVTYLVRRFDHNKVGMALLQAEEEKLNCSLRYLAYSVLFARLPYFIKSLVFEWKRTIHFNFDLSKIKTDVVGINIGFSYFVEQRLYSKISIMIEEDLKNLVLFCLLKCTLYDIQLSCLNSLRSFFKSEGYQLKRIDLRLDTIYQILKEFSMKSNYKELTSLCIELMFYTIEHFINSPCKPTPHFFCNQFVLYSLQCLSSHKTSSSIITFILPVVCGMLSFKKDIDLELTHKLASYVKSRCDPSFDQDMRVHAAKAMIFLIPVLRSEKVKDTLICETIWEACIEFLQDEIPEVRYEGSRFVTCYYYTINVRNPFVSLEYMLRFVSITTFMFPKRAMKCLWRKMICVSDQMHSTDGIKNPFDHEKKNFFAEQNIVSNMAYQTLLEIAKSSDCALKSDLKALCNGFTKEKYHSILLSSHVKNIEAYVNCDSVEK